MRIVTAVTLAAALIAAPFALTGPAHAATGGPAVVARARAATTPSYDHIVIVMDENHAYGQVIGNSQAPYLTSLANTGADMTQSYAVTHPSQPNYLALFSGSTHGLTSDSCPHTFSTENLAHQLSVAGKSFAGYSESLPSTGYTGCTSGEYARKHSPWVNFSNIPTSENVPFSSFPTDYTKLPKVSFVIPNLCDDMHDCSVATGDTWLKNNLGAYATWASTHNSLLLVTFDEDDSASGNQISTVFHGAHVTTGAYSEHITHYSVLRTLETLNGLGCISNSCSATAITDIWN